jgi:hypothetical protein
MNSAQHLGEQEKVMNIKGMLVALAMAGSAAAITGCSDVSSLASGAAGDQVASAASNGFFWRSYFTTPVLARPVVRTYYNGVYVRVAPPAARVEVIGHAPSANHFFVHGYHRWTGSRYEWVGGHWDVKRAGYTFVQGHWDRIGGAYRFVPGHWVRG